MKAKSPTADFRYEAAAFCITAKSNLQPGAGGENYWIIDNLVQRDPATNFPCINSTSLKGALREFFKHYLSSSGSGWMEILFHIFGHDKSDVPDEEEDKYEKYYDKKIEEAEANEGRESLSKFPKINIPATYRFLQADLLSMPVRSDIRMFYRVSSPYLIENFRDRLSMFGIKHRQLDTQLDKLQDISFSDKAHHGDEKDTAFLEEEEFKCTYSKIVLENDVTDLMGSHLAMAENKVICELVDDYHLPVIARNHLEDGRSTNLWYEQVLPRETKLFFIVLYPTGDPYFDTFRNIIIAHPVQIGANASVGYGFCKIDQIPMTGIKS